VMEMKVRTAVDTAGQCSGEGLVPILELATAVIVMCDFERRDMEMILVTMRSFFASYNATSNMYSLLDFE
jgi:hypothetical protein